MAPLFSSLLGSKYGLDGSRTIWIIDFSPVRKLHNDSDFFQP
jgi:hypothetical protein